MHQKTALIMRVLVNRYSSLTPEEFFNFLPADDVRQIADLSTESKEVSSLVKSPFSLLEKIHYSWLTPLFESLSPEAQSILLPLLPKNQAERLGSLFQVQPTSFKAASSIKKYLANLILNKIEGIRDVLPLELLPPTSFTPLLGMKKEALVEFIECLGIQDIAGEIRHIVDRKNLQKIYECLTPKEQSYLRQCLYQKEKIAAPPLGLEKWTGNCEKLKKAMQSRGFMRLGKALSGEHPDLVWHIAHLLDTGRGNALMRSYSRKAFVGVTPALAQQVLNLNNFFY